MSDWIKGLPDLHVHSKFSDGVLSVEEVYQTAVRGGYPVGISDHYSPGYQVSSAETLRRYLDEVGKYPVFASLEFDVGHELPIPLDVEDRLDYFIGGVHTLDFDGKLVDLWDPKAQVLLVDEFVDALLSEILVCFENHRIDILAHPTHLPPRLGPPNGHFFSETWEESLIEAAMDFEVALEINGGVKVPHLDFIKRCVRMGAILSIGSDAHNQQEMIDNLSWCQRQIELARVPEELIFKPKRELV